MIRLATDSDAPAIARIHVRAWQAAYAGIVPAGHLASLSIEQRTEQWQRILRAPTTETLVYDDGEVRGWINFGPSRDAPGSDEMEIFAIYLAPDFWRRGIGRALLDAAGTVFGTRAVPACVLWVLERNARARRFYESAGMTLDGARKKIEIGGAALIEVRYRKPFPRPQ